MTRWCTRVAVFAAWLSVGLPAMAQEGYPSPVGAARLPDPIRYVPDQPVPNNLVPGPMNPLMAPLGPPESLNLPAGHSSAFQLERYPPESKWYASLGGQALRRQGLAREGIVLPDNGSLGIDTGITPIGIIPTVLGANNVSPPMSGGFRATLGSLFSDVALELTGFWNPYNSKQAEVIGAGNLFIPFGPDNRIPLGFEGNVGLWRQADYARVTYTGGVGSGEFNYRSWNSGLNDAELLLGVRYFYAQERIDILTDDERNIRDIFLQPDPLRRATYTAGVRNNFLGAQMGGEYGCPLPIPWLQKSVWGVVMGKAAIGPNYIERTFRLTRGDGFQGFNQHQNSVLFATVSEATGCLDFHILDRLRVRAGYTFIMATGFSAAASQIDFNFTTQGQRGTDSGSVFYHGPIGELQLLF